MTDAHIAIEVMDFFLRDDATVPQDRLKLWIGTRDPDVLSVIYEAVSRGSGRVLGGVEPGDYFELVSKLFRVVQSEKGQSEYALSPYDAARVYAAFLVQCAGDSSLQDAAGFLRSGAAELEAIYRAGDDAQRRCVVDGVLEHAFANGTVRAAFSHWQKDPELRVAYLEATEWDQG